MLDYLAYVETVADGDLFTDRDHYYGDWCDMLPELGMTRPLGRCQSFNTPPEITVAAIVSRAYDQMGEMAKIMGRDADAARFHVRRDEIRTAFHAAFYDAEAGSYGSQTANAMALSFGIVPQDLREGVAAALEYDVRVTWDGHHSVGALGEAWLYPALSDYGHTDTAYGVFAADGAPGYEYLFNTLNGTTLWEDISKYEPERGVEPGKSLNHPFKGGYDGWFYSGLGGIQPDPAHPGYKHFSLSPVFPSDLAHATVSLAAPYGMIRSAWKREDGGITWSVSVPHNTSATVSLPGPITSDRTIGPGDYQFCLTGSGEAILDWSKQ